MQPLCLLSAPRIPQIGNTKGLVKLAFHCNNINQTGGGAKTLLWEDDNSIFSDFVTLHAP